MGVQGLSSLLGNHRNIYRDVELKNTRLVVDGCNLLYLMYFNSGLDQNHGGEYAAFEARIERFVSTLRGCGVEPFVLVDGGADPSDKKLETICKRSKDRVQKAQLASKSGTSQSILPVMAKVVFRQTLARLKVPLAQCYAEADQEMAALAREWDIPLLSNDGDFYVFDLPAGFLPFSHFRWEEAAAVRTSGSPRSIPCKKYNISSFCTFFRVQRSLMPAFAALAGNDYVKRYSKELNITWYQHGPQDEKTSSARRLEGGLRWLRGFETPSEAFEAAAKLMQELSREQRKTVLDDWQRGMKEYDVLPSSLKNFFVHGVAPPFPNAEEQSPELPYWLRQPLTEARLTADILDVLQLSRLGLSILVEDSSLPSAHRTSRPLRQAMYGLLLGRNTTVEETDRVRDELQVVPVRGTKHGAAEQLTLLSLQQAEESQRLQVLLETLRLDPKTWDAVSQLEAQLRLPVAVTCYWFQQAQPRPDQQILSALLLLLSLEDGPEPRRALQERMTQCTPTADVGVTHALNQWQSCLKDTIHLNQLLGWPLTEPCVARLYEGTLVHQMACRMKAGRHQRSLQKGVGLRVDVYKRLLATVLQSGALQAAPPAPGSTIVAQRSPARRAPPLDDLASSMLQLFVTLREEEEDWTMEQEVDPYNFLWVKNRYMTKERRNRHSNLDLIRKQNLRGRDLL